MSKNLPALVTDNSASLSTKVDSVQSTNSWIWFFGLRFISACSGSVRCYFCAFALFFHGLTSRVVAQRLAP
jgi:hypothetical protein